MQKEEDMSEIHTDRHRASPALAGGRRLEETFPDLFKHSQTHSDPPGRAAHGGHGALEHKL